MRFRSRTLLGFGYFRKFRLWLWSCLFKRIFEIEKSTKFEQSYLILKNLIFWNLNELHFLLQLSTSDMIIWALKHYSTGSVSGSWTIIPDPDSVILRIWPNLPDPQDKIVPIFNLFQDPVLHRLVLLFLKLVTHQSCPVILNSSVSRTFYLFLKCYE